MTAPKNSPIRRSLRRFLLGSGPLKRRSDRIQVIGRFVVALALLLAPSLAVAAANATTTHLREIADAEAAQRSSTRAVLLETARVAGHDHTDDGDSGINSVTPVPVPAAWRGPGGTWQEGLVMVRPGTPMGTAVPVWVDRGGNLTRPPLDRAGISTSAAGVGVLPLIGVPLVAWTLYAVLCFWLDARRERRWERDWAAVEPDWHSRLL